MKAGIFFFELVNQKKWRYIQEKSGSGGTVRLMYNGMIAVRGAAPDMGDGAFPLCIRLAGNCATLPAFYESPRFSFTE